MSRLLHPGLPQAQMPPALPLLTDYLLHGARNFPDRPAFVEGAHSASYGEVASEVDTIARGLLAAGVTRGDRVATLAPPSTTALKLFLASASIGAYWLGLNPRYSRHELAHPVEDAEPKLLFAEMQIDGRDYTDELAAIVREAGTGTAIVPLPLGETSSEDWEKFLSSALRVSQQELANARSAVDPEDPCLIVYTSGTTGLPKGALISHYGLVYCSRTDARYNLHSQGQRMLCNFPINHIACIGDVCATTLVVGGTLVFMRNFDPAGILRTIETERISHLGQIPAMLQMTLAQPDMAAYDLSSLRTLLWGGNPASVELVARLRKLCDTLVNVYGLTETTGNVLFARGELADEQLANSVGFAPPEYEVAILDSDGRAVEPGQIGEIHVRGDFLMKGYWRNPEATRAAFTIDGWLRTGDLATPRPDGLIALVGRRSEMFKSGGYNIYPAEIEQALERHPDVLLAAVVGVPDPLYSEVGAAFVIAKSAALDERALREHCGTRLANFKIPKHIRLLDALPMLPNGKVDKRRMKALLTQGANEGTS
jgi:acyl-CoA synthetase (AMP-forming)/AMP-acid ligase II